MAEYIEREAALAQVHEINIAEVGYRHRCIDPQTIREIPAADAQPVRHGWWIMRGGKWRCSECGQKALLRLSDATGGCREYEYYRANYCPNCGAKMDKEADE